MLPALVCAALAVAVAASASPRSAQAADTLLASRDFVPQLAMPIAGSPIPDQMPAPNPGANLQNPNKNTVMHNLVVYAVFWLPSAQHFESSASADGTYESVITKFIKDLGGNNFYNIVTQYPDANGAPANSVTFGGQTVDTTAYPHAGTTADPLTDGDIRAAVTRAATGNSWSEDDNHLYAVFTSLNAQECQNQNAAGGCSFKTATVTMPYCAYHSSFSDSGKDAIYAFMGDDGHNIGTGLTCIAGQTTGDNDPNRGTYPNGDQLADAEVNTLSHETIEAVTDPKITAWLDANGFEIGDKCNFNFGPRNVNGADVFLNGDPYIVQQEWSNAVSACAQDLCGTSDCPPLPSFVKSADTTVTTGQNFQISIQARNPSHTDAATNLTVTDPLPAGATFSSSTPAPATVNGQTVTWNFTNLPPHASQTITIRAVAGAGLQNGTGLHNCATLDYGDSLQNSQSRLSSCADTTAVNVPPTLVLPGSQTGDFHDPMSFTISATDPEASDTLTFGSAGLPAGLTLTDNGNRTATISGMSTAVPATYVVTFSVSDGHNPAVTGTLNVIIMREESALVITGPTVIANGQPLTMAATMLEDGNPAIPIGGRAVTLTLGSGSSAQSCPATTLPDGSAICTIAAVSQSLGPGTMTASFAGDAFYLPSSASAQTLVFAFLARGAFVIGDESSAVGTAVTFWGAQWAALNMLSGSASPDSFKGFAATTSEPPAKGDDWATRPGDSSGPPSPPLPGYMGVVVSDSITESGATISGDTVHIVVVKVDSGYEGNPGHAGTGTVVAVFS